jgi:hypothetical protein
MLTSNKCNKKKKKPFESITLKIEVKEEHLLRPIRIKHPKMFFSFT